MAYQNPDHPFFNAEIKPALVVINLLLGLLLPFTLIIGLGLLVAKPLQLLFSPQATWYQTVVVLVAGVGLPASITWSLFATWRHYRQARYRQAFWASLAPVIFGAAMLVLFGLVYIIDTVVLLFR
jgi:hypothetical protein